jgi:hypothetical protein
MIIYYSFKQKQVFVEFKTLMILAKHLLPERSQKQPLSNNKLPQNINE